jgi:hypothetical protein
MSANEDRDLKDAFEALGRSVRMTEPSFDHMTSRETLNAARWRQRRRRAVLLVIAVAVPAFLALRARSHDALDYKRFTALTGLDLSEVTWEAPSDFLLDVPGRDLLRSVPLIEVDAPAFTLDSVQPPISNDTQRRSRS